MLDKYGLRPHCQFETAVTGAHWDEASARWRVSTRSADGTTQHHEARFIISCCGSLNIPRLPDIEGIDSFNGHAFHSTRWPSDFDHQGLRFALLS